MFGPLGHPRDRPNPHGMCSGLQLRPRRAHYGGSLLPNHSANSTLMSAIQQIVDDETGKPGEKPRKKVIFSSPNLTLDLRYCLDCASPNNPPGHSSAAHPVPQAEELCHLDFEELDLRPQGHKGLSACAEITLAEGNVIWFILRDVPVRPKDVPDHDKLSSLTKRATAEGLDLECKVSLGTITSVELINGFAIVVALRGAAALRPADDPLLTPVSEQPGSKVGHAHLLWCLTGSLQRSL